MTSCLAVVVNTINSGNRSLGFKGDWYRIRWLKVKVTDYKMSLAITQKYDSYL